MMHSSKMNEANRRYWEGAAYTSGEDSRLVDWLTVAAQKPG
jgi:hypothetical protein